MDSPIPDELSPGAVGQPHASSQPASAGEESEVLLLLSDGDPDVVDSRRPASATAVAEEASTTAGRLRSTSALPACASAPERDDRGVMTEDGAIDTPASAFPGRKRARPDHDMPHMWPQGRVAGHSRAAERPLLQKIATAPRVHTVSTSKTGVGVYAAWLCMSFCACVCMCANARVSIFVCV